MMDYQKVLNNTDYYNEWLTDIKNSYSYDSNVMAMYRTVKGNCKTLEDALHMLVSYQQYDYYKQTADFLIKDMLIDFLMIDI